MIATALAVAAASLGPVVLRGSAQPDDRTISSIDQRGVELAASDDPTPTLVGWEHIKLVTGDDAPRAAPFAQLADDAWRARARLLRHDLELAAPLLEKLVVQLKDVPSPTALLAFAGMARVRAESGDLTGAIESWHAAAALHAKGIRIDTDLAEALRLDQTSGIITDLPVFWLPLPPPPTADRFLTQMLRALEVDPTARAAARVEIIALIPSETVPWREAWLHAALGRSYLMETDPDPRALGLLELFHLPVRFAYDQPLLTRLALTEILTELTTNHDATSAEIIREQLRRIDHPSANTASSLSPGEQLARYFESLHLTAPLAEHLESELRSADGPARIRIAQRLAEVYAQLLESTNDADQVKRLEQRAGSLLTDVPEADSLDLRLTLARSAYSRAEQQAERWRLRINARADADAARRAFVDLERQFADLAIAAEKRIDSLEKQEEQTTGAGPDRTLLASALSNVRRTRSMGHFLAGWSAYYIAELEPAASAEAVARAERHFGWLLNAKSGSSPTTDRVPTQLLTYEHVARAAIGIALCESLKGAEESALRWINLVESTPGIHESVARQLTARKVIVLARAHKWADVAAAVDPRGGGSAAATLSPSDARLLAVLALEARQAGENAAGLRPLIILALESLAGKGELDQVLDLASRYFDRVDDIAPGGFLPAYIRGLREYDRATRDREAAKGPNDQPAASPETRRTYAAATRFLHEALSSSDAPDFDAAIPGVEFLRALARFYSAQSESDLNDAASLFTGAAERFDQRNPAEAARARLLAIRALDTAIALDTKSFDSAPIANHRRALIDDFLVRHPVHPAASTLLFERAVSTGATPRDAARDLLSIPDNSPLAFNAHHQAGRLLYELMLAAPPDSRPAAAEDFLAAAEPLLDPSRRPPAGDAEAANRFIATARRVVDALLKTPNPDPSRVRRSLELLTGTVARGVAIPPELLPEIEYRSVQIALLENDWAAAESARERLQSLDPSLAGAAQRAMYQRAADQFNQSPADSPDRSELARTVLRLGRVVIETLPAPDNDPARPAVATLYFNTARAASAHFAAAHDTAAAVTATDLFTKLIAAYPTDANFLRGAATHADLIGDSAAALAAWRGLLAGLPQGSPEWFDAKCRVITLLTSSDPAAARAAIEQHRVLFPDLGPEPWRSRLLKQEKALQPHSAGGAP